MWYILLRWDSNPQTPTRKFSYKISFNSKKYINLLQIYYFVMLYWKWEMRASILNTTIRFFLCHQMTQRLKQPKFRNTMKPSMPCSFNVWESFRVPLIMRPACREAVTSRPVVRQIIAEILEGKLNNNGVWHRQEGYVTIALVMYGNPCSIHVLTTKTWHFFQNFKLKK